MAEHWTGYAIAIAGTGAAAVLRWVLEQWLSEVPPFITFYPAVVATAFLGGTGPGVLATILGSLAGCFWVASPVGSIWPPPVSRAAGAVLFGVINIAISVAAGRLRAASVQSLLWAAALRSAANAILVTDRKGAILWVNPAFERLTGYSAPEVVGQNPRLLKSGSHDPAFYKKMWETLDAGLIWQGELVNKRKDGTLYSEEMTITPVKDTADEVAHFIAVKQDITRRKQIESLLAHKLEELQTAKEHLAEQNQVLEASRAELQRERGRYRELFDFAPDGYLLTNLNSNIQEVNLAACRALGESQAFLLRLPFLQFVASADKQKLLNLLSCFRKQPAPESESVEVSILPPRGELFPCALTVNTVRTPSGLVAGLRWLMRDITASRRAEEALRESEQQFRTLADCIPNLAWWADGDGRVTWYNRRWYEYTGAAPEQVEGWGWQSLHDPELLPRVLERWKASIASGAPFEMEFPLRGADGRFRWFLTRGMPLRDDSGRVVRWFGTNTDVSETREAHEVLARSKEELEQLVRERTVKLYETIEELEGFSYSIVHDMRAPLRAMQNFAALAQAASSKTAPAEVLDYLRRIKIASTRLDRLITDALNYSKVVREEFPVTPVDAAGLLHGIVETYPNFHSPAVEINIDFEGLLVMGNESALTQVFSNLLGNAVKFVAPGVKPRVRVWAQLGYSQTTNVQSRAKAGPGQPSGDAEHATHNTHHDLPPSPFALRPSQPLVRIWFEDNGIGIPKEARSRIFGMFQRLHREEEYPGTGIGLSIVRKAMERMGGRVGVESEVGRGSRFWIELRRVDEGAGAFPMEKAA